MVKLLVVLISITACALGLPQVKHDDGLNWRIIGGGDAKDNQFPYQVSLRKNNNHFCSGSIIKDRWILTAAQCVDGRTAASFKVVCGSTTLTSGGIEHAVSKITVHPGWNSKKYINDIALVQTAEKIIWKDNVVGNITNGTVADGVDVVFSGWGATSSTGSVSNILQFLKLKTVKITDCQKNHTSPSVVDTQVCTFTKKGEGACYGDSGGPLIKEKELVGIFSWGRLCAQGYPDVFTRVSNFTSWIENNTK